MADEPLRDSYTPRHAVTYELTERGLKFADDQIVTAEADERDKFPLSNDSGAADPAPASQPDPPPAVEPAPAAASGEAEDGEVV